MIGLFLTMLALMLPAIVATTLQITSDKKKNRWLIYGILYFLLSNGVVILGLAAIGMRDFNILDMSNSFKIKWMLIGMMFAIAVPLFLRHIKNQKLADIGYDIKENLTFSVGLIFICVVAIPSILFLNNIDEFGLRYYQVIGLIIVVAISTYILLTLISIFIFGREWIKICNSLYFAILVGVYVQSNFLNPVLPSMDGAAVRWGDYSREILYSTVVWIVIIAVSIILVIRWKEKIEKIYKYLIYFLIGIHIITVATMIITCPLKDEAKLGFSAEDEFTLGKEANVVIFVVDTLQQDLCENYLKSDAYNGAFEDFEIYDNMVSGGAPTEMGLPVLLTGMEYDGIQNLKAYYSDAWNQSPVYDIGRAGVDVRLYTDWLSARDVPGDIAANGIEGVSNYIENPIGFLTGFYRLAGVYMMPQIVKSFMWLSTADVINSVGTQEYEGQEKVFHIDDARYYKELIEQGSLNIKYEKAFRLYHLFGAHAPYHIDETMKKPEDGGTEMRAVIGCMNIVKTYIDYMKEAGVYENSMIIITGDHGEAEIGNVSTNPCFMIKNAGSHSGMVVNHAPVCFRNVASTYYTYATGNDDRGATIYDIDENSDVERLHTINFIVTNRTVHMIHDGYGEDKEGDHVRLVLHGDAAGLEQDFDIWNPYEINVVDYEIGKEIDLFNTKEIDYRVYREEEKAYISNEFTMCMDAGAIDTKKDFELHMLIDDVIGDEQTMYVYVAGSKLESFEVESIQGEIEKVFSVPRDSVKDGKIYVRVVCPYAVTKKQITGTEDTRVMSVALDKIWLKQK